MDVNVPAHLQVDADAVATASLIEKCVHCGFCNSACPTYGLEQDERDGPRGRIYLIKELLEGNGSATVTQHHLDRCLTCRACETACPSGVEYARIIHFGRILAQRSKLKRKRGSLWRHCVGKFVHSRNAMRLAAALARSSRGLLPAGWRRMFAATLPRRKLPLPPTPRRKVTMLAGCLQSSLMPATNVALNELLELAECEVVVIPTNRCCGALSYHNDRPAEAFVDIRRTLASVRRSLTNGSDAVLIAASGCASFMREYPHLPGLPHDAISTALAVAKAVVDPAQLLADNLSKLHLALATKTGGSRVTLHTPCSQAHGLHTPATAATQLLRAAGYTVELPSSDSACCGSAGTYSLLHPRFAQRLRADMTDSLEQAGGEVIASGNIGCILHLRQGTMLPVHHWLDLLVAEQRNCPWAN